MLESKNVILTIHHIVPDKFDDQRLREFMIRDRFVNVYHVPCKKTKDQISSLTKKPIFVIPFWANQNLWFDIKDKKGKLVVASGRRITARHIAQIQKAGLDTLYVPEEYAHGKVLARNVIDKESGEVVANANDEITDELLGSGYSRWEAGSRDPVILDEKDWFAVELEYQSRQARNDKGQLCFEFPVITRTREDKPLGECEVDDPK